MKTFLKILLVLLLLTAVSFGAVYAVLNTPDLLVKTVKFLAQRQQAAQFKDLKVRQAGFLRDGKYRLEGVSAQMTLKDQKSEYQFDADQVLIGNLFPALIRGGSLSVSVDGLRLRDPENGINADGFKCKAQAWLSNPFIWSGYLAGRSLQWQDYTIDNVTSEFNTDAGQITLVPFQADLYGGAVTGKISLEYARDVAYHIDVSIREVDALRLKEAQPLFENIRGRISGQIQLDGNPEHIKNLTGSFKAVEGGQVKAVLLQPILQYVPAAQQKAQLEKLVAEGGMVPLQTAQVDLDSVEEEKLTTRWNLKSKEYNLDLHLTVDLNVEGGLMQMLQMQKQLF